MSPKDDPLRTTDLVPAPVPENPPTPAESDKAPVTFPPLEATTPESASASAAPLLLSIPGYAIEAVLGRGGMGVVYRAHHLALKRTVALKMVLAGSHAGPAERARFRLEAEAVARLQHPNIVQIHEVGEADGHPYCALEFVAGGSLADRIKDQPLPARDAAHLVETLARAMQLAHSRNVVHRDLKPANILLAADGTPRITDFGLARQLDSDSGETMAGAVMGTPSYMAPEQASGRTREAGPAADVYALGGILYACLTGRPPFKGRTTVETLDQVRTQEPVPPSRWQKNVPLDLESICLKCLRKQPERRYASAAELADDLVRYQRGEPTRARPVGSLERGWLLARRNPVVSGLTVLVFLSLILGLGFSLYYMVRSDLDAQEARDQTAVAKAATKEEKSARFAEARALYLTEMNLAARSFRDGEIPVVRDLLARCLPGPDGIDRRGPEWALLQRQAAGCLRVLDTDVTDAHAIAWHPSGQLLFSSRAKKFGARDAITGAALFETELPPMTAALAVRPDGKQVAAAVWGNRVHLIDGTTGRQTKGPAFGTAIRAVSYRPDGRELVTGCADFRVRRHDVQTGAVLQTLPRSPIGHHAFVIGAAYAPGSSHIVSLDVYRWLIRWDPATGSPVWKLQTESGSIAKSLAVHPHRPLAALGFTVSSRHAPDYGYIELRELERGAFVSSLECGGGIQHLAFNPEGDLLAAACLDGIVRIWDVHTREQVTELAGHESLAAAIAWHPDGWRLASTGDRTLRLASVRTTALERSWSGTYIGAVLHPRGECVLLWGGVPAGVRVPLDGPLQKMPIPELSGPVHGGSWSADGRWVALAVQNHVEIRDGKTLHVRHRLPDGPFWVTSLRFTPDGERLVTHDGNGQVCVWEAATGKLLRSWKGARSLGQLAVAPDGARVAVLNQSVALFRLDTGDRLWEKAAEHPAQYTALDFLPDGRLLVGCDDGEIRLFAAEPGADPVRKLRSRSKSVVGLRAVAGGGVGAVPPTTPPPRRLFSQDREGVLTIWDVDSAELLRKLPEEVSSGPLVLDPEGRWLVRGVGERWALWDLRPRDESLARRQEAFALVDHLAGRCADRADLLRRVRTHPAVADDVRGEALALAERYNEDAAALQWEVFDTACAGGRSAKDYAEQLARAQRTLRALPDQPVPLMARAALRLRLDQPGAAEDLRSAECRLPPGVSIERFWLIRLQALEAAKNKRPAEARALTTRADAMLQFVSDPQGRALKMEALSLIPRQP